MGTKKQQPSHVGLFQKLKAQTEAKNKAIKNANDIWGNNSVNGSKN